MKKIIFTLLGVVMILSSCSGAPYKLKKTAERDMLIFGATNTQMTEAEMYSEPLLIDQLQITEDKWCMTYEIAPLLRFSTIWDKQERDWVRTDIKPNTENCNWAR